MYCLTGGNGNNDAIFLSPDLDVKKSISTQVWPVDNQYIPVLGMKVIAGRNFSKDFLTDSMAVVINEAAVGLMHGENPIGAKLYEIDDLKTKKMKEFHVIGVVKNFNFNSLRQVVTPMMLYFGVGPGADFAAYKGRQCASAGRADRSIVAKDGAIAAFQLYVHG